MAGVPWVWLTVFFLLPLVLVLADVLYLAKEYWTVPWLALLGMIWFGVGVVVGIGSVDTEPAST